MPFSNNMVLSWTTTTSILMPLSQLVGLTVFALIRSRHCSRLYASSLLKPYSSKSFFMHSSQDVFGWHFFFFSFISTSITSCIWELMSPCMAWPYHHRWLWMIISSNFTTTLTLWRGTLVDTLSTSYTPHIILIWLYIQTKPCLIRNSKLPRFTSVQQNWSNITLINLPPLFER